MTSTKEPKRQYAHWRGERWSLVELTVKAPCDYCDVMAFVGAQAWQTRHITNKQTFCVSCWNLHQ